ncbi:hypothetical protein [Bacillus paramycoides]|nr:hypothetical protein [Bacillus paramycoides]
MSDMKIRDLERLYSRYGNIRLDAIIAPEPLKVQINNHNNTER